MGLWGDLASFQAAILTLAGTWFKVQLTGNVKEGERVRPGRAAPTASLGDVHREQGESSMEQGPLSCPLGNPVPRVSALWDGTPLKAGTPCKALLGQTVLHVFS